LTPKRLSTSEQLWETWKRPDKRNQKEKPSKKAIYITAHRILEYKTFGCNSTGQVLDLFSRDY